MPINIPGFNVGQVPVGQRIQPLQQPQYYDPAGIIMQAAELRQKKELTRQEMQQKELQSLVENIQGAASLAEKKRETTAIEKNAALLMELKEKASPVELEHLQAQTELAKSQAKMMSGGNFSAIMDNPTIPPSMKLEMFSNRNGLRASIWDQYIKDHPGIDVGKAQQQYDQGLMAARTAGGTSVQIPEAMAKTFDVMKSKLLPLARQTGFGDYPAANAAGLWLHKHIKSNGDIAKYDAAMNETARQLAQVFSANGVPVEYAQKSASDILHTDMGVSGLQAITSETLPDIVSSRIEGLKSIGVQINQPAEKQAAGAFDALYKKHGLQ